MTKHQNEVEKVHLDVRRLLCPMPVIRVQNRVEKMSPGSLLEATCTDPGVLSDIPAWCRINGHKVISAEQQGDEYIILLEVGKD